MDDATFERLQRDMAELAERFGNVELEGTRINTERVKNLPPVVVKGVIST